VFSTGSVFPALEGGVAVRKKGGRMILPVRLCHLKSSGIGVRRVGYAPTGCVMSLRRKRYSLVKGFSSK